LQSSKSFDILSTNAQKQRQLASSTETMLDKAINARAPAFFILWLSFHNTPQSAMKTWWRQQHHVL
jgi:preprotein translocase subunit SecG